MNWVRLPDLNGFARWRGTGGRFGGVILASAGRWVIVSVEGVLWSASTHSELEAGLVRLFLRVDLETYRAALSALREAWAFVGKESLEPVIAPRRMRLKPVWTEAVPEP